MQTSGIHMHIFITW